MAIVSYAGHALSDLERLSDFLLESDPGAAQETIDLIVTAIDVLKHHPLVGRITEEAYRELVISRGATGYLALYRYDEARDAVLVLTIRHQRESGYSSHSLGD